MRFGLRLDRGMGGLVPVDVLVHGLADLHADDDHERHRDGLADGLHAGQHPVDLGRVGER